MENYSPKDHPIQFPIQNLLEMELTMARTLLGAIGVLLTAHLACFPHESRRREYLRRLEYLGQMLRNVSAGSYHFVICPKLCDGTHQVLCSCQLDPSGG